jgi:hypothetical protein
MMRLKQLPILPVFLLICLTGCGVRTITPPPVPTPIPLDVAATAFVMTENAPPAGYETISFPRIDAGLTQLPGWHYKVTLTFDGVFARTTRTASASTTAEVSFNQVASARRVAASVDNDLQDSTPPLAFEAVRLGQEVFLVRDGGCTADAGDEAVAASDFSAGAILGGIQQARTAGKKATINSESVWLYSFEAADLVMPNVTLNADSRINSLVGELWVAPARNAVIRYYATMEAENVVLFQGELPVTGTLRIEYDVYDIGISPNISVPFGC